MLNKTESRTADLYAEIFSHTGDTQFNEKAAGYLDRTGIDPEWFSAKTCLDAGCGDGTASYALSGIKGSRVTAFDISSVCLTLAKKKLSGSRNFTLVQSRVEAVPFKDNVFDFINCNGVLHHIPDIDEALSELFRVLKPQGILFIGIYGRGGLLNGYKIGFCRLFTRIIPYKLLGLFLRKKNRNECLDNLCVPLRKGFSEREIGDKLQHYGFSGIARIAKDFYRRPRSLREKLIMGPDGMYLHFLARKAA